MTHVVAIVQDDNQMPIGGYIVLGDTIEHVRPLWDRHQDLASRMVEEEPGSITVMDGPNELARYDFHDFE